MATRKTAGKRKMARKSAKASSRRTSASKRGGRKMAAKRGSARKSAPKKTARRSPVARVKRVTREVVEQAQVAVAAGVETLKDLGENLMERVRPSTTT